MKRIMLVSLFLTAAVFPLIALGSQEKESPKTGQPEKPAEAAVRNLPEEPKEKHTEPLSPEAEKQRSPSRDVQPVDESGSTGIVAFPGPEGLSYREYLKYYEGFPELTGWAMAHDPLPPEERRDNFVHSTHNGDFVISGAYRIGYQNGDTSKLSYGILAEPAVIDFGGYTVTLAAGYPVEFYNGEYLSNYFVLKDDAVLPGNYSTLAYAGGTPVRFWSEKCIRYGTLAEDQKVQLNVLPAGTKVEFTEEDTLIRPSLVIEGLIKWMRSPKPVRLKGYKYDLLFTEAEFDEKGYVMRGKLAEPFSSSGLSCQPGDWVDFNSYWFDPETGDSGDPARMDFLQITPLPLGEPRPMGP